MPPLSLSWDLLLLAALTLLAARPAGAATYSPWLWNAYSKYQADGVPEAALFGQSSPPLFPLDRGYSVEVRPNSAREQPRSVRARRGDLSRPGDPKACVCVDPPRGVGARLKRAYPVEAQATAFEGLEPAPWHHLNLTCCMSPLSGPWRLWSRQSPQAVCHGPSRPFPSPKAENAPGACAYAPTGVWPRACRMHARCANASWTTMHMLLCMVDRSLCVVHMLRQSPGPTQTHACSAFVYLLHGLRAGANSHEWAALHASGCWQPQLMSS